MMHEVVKIGLRQLPPENRRILLEELDKGTRPWLGGTVTNKLGLY